MTERKRVTGLAEQIELARHYQEQCSDWVRSTAHFAGSNHAGDLESEGEVAEHGTACDDNQAAVA